MYCRSSRVTEVNAFLCGKDGSKNRPLPRTEQHRALHLGEPRNQTSAKEKQSSGSCRRAAAVASSPKSQLPRFSGGAHPGTRGGGACAAPILIVINGITLLDLLLSSTVARYVASGFIARMSHNSLNTKAVRTHRMGVGFPVCRLLLTF